MSDRRRILWVLAVGLVSGASAAIVILKLIAQPLKYTPRVLPSRPVQIATKISETKNEKLSSIDIQRLNEILGQGHREYVDDVPHEKLIDAAVRGMVTGLDPYSTYLDRNEYADIRSRAAGSYPGIGIEITIENSLIKILRPLANSPAARAGIRDGDIIVTIDQKPVGTDIDAAIEQMRGPAGSRVRLTVRHPASAELIDLSLERAHVEVQSVSGALLDTHYGYVRIAYFSDTTPADFIEAVATIKKEKSITAGPLLGLILDLRNNPGGVLEAATGVADAMLERGTLVTSFGRAEDARFSIKSNPGQALVGIEMVVLVNGASASASEILAGALKDNNRALFIGRRTYGKGLVQSIISLSDGRALKLTTSRYATPSGAFINERGIIPDVLLTGPDVLPGDPETDVEVLVALQELRKRAPPPMQPRIIARSKKLRK